jgi:hypothetical protein
LRSTVDESDGGDDEDVAGRCARANRDSLRMLGPVHRRSDDGFGKVSHAGIGPRDWSNLQLKACFVRLQPALRHPSFRKVGHPRKRELSGICGTRWGALQGYQIVRSVLPTDNDASAHVDRSSFALLIHALL